MNSGAQRDYKAGNVFTHSVLDALSQGDRNGGCRRLCAQRSEISRKHSAEAVFARNLSAEKSLRVLMAKHYMHVENHPVYNYQDTVAALEATLYAARLVGYAQGFALMRTASDTYKWNLNLSSIALLWRAGCIIRSAFLNDIAEAYHRAPGLSHMLLDRHFGLEVAEALPVWKKSVSIMLKEGLAVPVFSAALNYFLGLTTHHSQANMIQAMRDYFGAHTFERVDSPRGEFFHEQWQEKK